MRHAFTIIDKTIASYFMCRPPHISVSSKVLEVMMIRVAIPRYRLIESDGHSKNFYVYIVEVSCGGTTLTLEKRYSAFHRLYKEVCCQNSFR